MGEYKNAPTHIVWMWMFQKKLMGDNSRYSRGGRMQMLGKNDQKSMRGIVKALTKTTRCYRKRTQRPKKQLSS